MTIKSVDRNDYKCEVYPKLLQYPFQYFDNMRDAVLLAFYQRSLWATVVVHIHLGDKSPTIPICGTAMVRWKIIHDVAVQRVKITSVLLHLKERNLLWGKSQGGVQKSAG